MIAAHFEHLVFPLVPERRVAVQEKDERTLAHARIVQPNAVDIGVIILECRGCALRTDKGWQNRQDRAAEKSDRSCSHGTHTIPASPQRDYCGRRNKPP